MADLLGSLPKIVGIEVAQLLLESHDLKLCFFLCSLFPEGYEISIEDLARLAATELECDGSIEEKRILVESFIDTLVAKFLLIKCRGIGRKVKMHSMVRRFALQMLAKPENFFTGTYIDESNSFPANDVLASCMAISIMKKQNKELPEDLIYEKLRLMLVRAQDWKSISNNVFEGLPSLRALYLEECKLLNDISWLRYLTKIEMLSLRGSSITQVPDEISQMSDLKLLDVSHCQHLIKIPRGMLEKLSNLEELYTHGSQNNLWGAEIGKADLSEVKALTRLNIFSLEVRREQLVEGFILSKLGSHEKTKSIMILFNSSRVDSSFDILRIENADYSWMNALGKWELDLPEMRCALEGPTPIVPFANVTEVSIVNCESLAFLFSQSVAQSLVQLQKLKIYRCHSLEHIIMEEDGNATSSDHNQLSCFGNLKRLEVKRTQLKYILSIPIARGLENLEYFKESHNQRLEKIFGPGHEEVEIVLPRLTEFHFDRQATVNCISFPSLQNIRVGRSNAVNYNTLLNESDFNRLRNRKLDL